jgi:hypothetical protein
VIISVPPRHLKSHLASIAFPAWWLAQGCRIATGVPTSSSSTTR